MFLVAEKRLPMEICMKMKAVYGDRSYSHVVVVEWSDKFRQVIRQFSSNTFNNEK